MVTDEMIQEGLESARAELKQKNYTKAISWYLAVHDQDKSNLEAHWFTLAGGMELILKDNDKEKIPTIFEALSEKFLPVLSSISDKKDRKYVGVGMQYLFGELSNKIFDNHYMYREKVLSAYKTISQSIIYVLDDPSDSLGVATAIWIRTVGFRHRYCSYRRFIDLFKETWYDIMIKDIKKNYPEYTAPKFSVAPFMFKDI